MPDDGRFSEQALSVGFGFGDGTDEGVGAGFIPVPNAYERVVGELRGLHA